MRPRTALERLTTAAQTVYHYVWAEVEDADRTYRDLGTLGGTDWVESVEWSDSIDQPSATFTLRLRRDTQLQSIAPTMGGSVLNRNNAGAYAPLLDPGRNVRFFTLSTKYPYQVTTNYLKYSDQLDNASWTKAVGVAVVANATAAPDGNVTADKVTYSGAGVAGSFRIYQGAQAPLATPAIGQLFTLSIWLRADVATTVRLANNHGQFTICNLTTTWQRFSVVGTGTGLSAGQLLVYSNTADNAAFTIYAWGGQAELGNVATRYAPTTSVPASREPRNLVRWSEDFTNATWLKSGGGTGSAPVVTANFGTAPDGTLTADRVQFVLGAGLTSADLSLLSTTPVGSYIGQTLVHSVWMRTNDGTNKVVSLYAASAGSSRVTVTPVWQRFSSIVWAATGGATPQIRLRGSDGTDTSADLLVWGSQLEESTVASEYVMTQATAGLSAKKLAFRGRADAIKWNTSPVEVTGRDESGWIVDAFIQQERVIGSSTPTAIETLMAQVLANDPVFGAPTLYTPTSPGFLVANPTGAKQAKKSILEALQQDYALALGWVCRQRWDETTQDFRLTLFDVNRAKVVADDSFGPTEYEDITALEVSDAEVRNYIIGTYFDAAGKQHSRTVQNATSQGKYGVKFMEIDLALGDPIDSDAEMDAMLNAAVNDLGAPLTTQEMITLYAWFVELGDLYTFVQNGDHYDSDQKLAVVSYSHHFENGEGKTTMQCRGTVIGAYHAWFRRGVPGGDGTTSTDGIPEILQADVGFPAGTASVEVVLRGDINTGSWRVALSTTAQPSLATTRAAPVYTGQNIDVLITQSVVTGQKLYISVLAYSGVTGSGAESDLFQSSTTRDGVGGAVMPVPDIDLIYSDFTSFDLNFRGTFSPGAPLPCEFRYGVSLDSTGATITWSAWTDKSFLPFHYGLTNRQDKAATYIYLEVRQGSDNTTIQRETIVMDGTDIATGSDGKIIRSVPYNDGGFAIKATDTNGFIITSSGQESGLKLVNLLLAKPLASSPDNLNSVGDGSTRAAVAPGVIDLNNAPLLIAIPDTRSVAHAPTYYSKNARGQFKTATVIGLPSSGSGFAQVLGWRGWSDDSGDGAGELAMNADGRIYHRYGTTAGGWNAWNELARKSEVLSSSGGSILGNVTVTGVINIVFDGQAFATRPVTPGAASYWAWYDSLGSTRRAYIGLGAGSGSTADLYVNSDSGRVMIQANAGTPVATFGTAGILFSYTVTAPNIVLNGAANTLININSASAASYFQFNHQVAGADRWHVGIRAASNDFAWYSVGAAAEVLALGYGGGVTIYGDVTLNTATKTFKDSFGNSMAPIIVSSSAASGTAADKTLWAQV